VWIFLLGCIIQARMNSKRLPGKVMMKLDDKNPSLFYTISQLRNSKKIEKIIIATTSKTEDDIIEKFANKMDVESFRGSEDDVLDRFYNCAKKNNLENIIRITADCPLIDPTIVDEMIDEFKNNNFDYVQNIEPRTFPDGMEVEIFTFKALKEMWQNSKLPSEREHVTTYMRNKKEKFKIKKILCEKDLSKYRFTLDYSEDLVLIRNIVKDINQRPILMKDIISLLTKMPELLRINEKYEANEGYKLSLKKDEAFLKNRKYRKD